jgi:uncharacterized protein (TIGR03086 family)
MSLDSTDALGAAFEVARAQLTDVDPARLGDRTPCQSWDVRTLVNHMIAAPRFAASRVSGTPMSGAANEDFANGDLVAAHAETTRMTMDAFGAPGALDRPIALPFGERPGRFLMFFVASDQFAHAWDLARTLRHSTDIAPTLAAELLDEARTMVTPEMRGADGTAAFGPEATPPAGASAADQLAAYLGRAV